ncbi:hypothetical protein GCM10011409_27380 [Lentibacillus populi]|uniref:Uncharacterized protein n=1 Tax=Lentibacillus populi TaxID=1827502 RepID=A0A9W5TYK3_9BACI|nr:MULTISPECIES: hypothetical protein [Bacillaceae]GGB48359.1 hypothetical protein GCM10011409_27380 [Lentibacillus populi]
MACLSIFQDANRIYCIIGKNGQRIQYRMKLRAAIICQLAHENKTVHQVAENLGMTVKAVERSSFTPSI